MWTGEENAYEFFLWDFQEHLLRDDIVTMSSKLLPRPCWYRSISYSTTNELDGVIISSIIWYCSYMTLTYWSMDAIVYILNFKNNKQDIFCILNWLMSTLHVHKSRRNRHFNQEKFLLPWRNSMQNRTIVCCLQYIDVLTCWRIDWINQWADGATCD